MAQRVTTQTEVGYMIGFCVFGLPLIAAGLWNWLGYWSILIGVVLVGLVIAGIAESRKQKKA